MIISKKQFLEKIYEDLAVQQVLKQSKSDKEIRAARAAVDELLGNFFDNIVNASASVQKDAEVIKKTLLENDDQIISNEAAEIVESRNGPKDK